MTFLRLNGWTIPVADGSAGRSQETLGEYGRSYGGRPSTRRQAIAKGWSGRAFPMASEDADTLSALLEGRGHRWGFDRSLYSSAGLGPEAGFDESVIGFYRTTDIPVPYCIRLEGESLIYDANLPAEWTALYWYSADPISTITNYVPQSERLLTTWVTVQTFRQYEKEQNPSGGPESTILRDGTAFGSHNFYINTTTLTGGTTYSASIYIKEAGRFRGRLAVESTTTGDRYYQEFNLQTQQVTATGQTGGFAQDWGILDVGGGWFRIHVTGFLTVTQAARLRIYLHDENGSASYTGANLGFYLWGAQKVQAGRPSRYIPTASVARTLSMQRAWEYRVIRSDGLKWLDSIQFDYPTPEFGVDNGAAIISGGTFADFVLLPFKASAAFIESFYLWATMQTGPKTWREGNGFSDLPRLHAWGDMVQGEDPVEVLGVSSAESYVQHGAKDGSGWRNNSRDIPVTLAEVTPRETGPTLPFRASLAFLLDDRITGSSYSTGLRRPLVGNSEYGLSISNPYVVDFPFADFQVRTWPSASSSWAESNTAGAFGQIMEGAEAVSMVAFVRRSTLSTQQTIAMFEIGTNSSHFGMDVLSTNRLRIGGRSRSTDAFQSLQLTARLVSDVGDDSWVAVGGFLDFANGAIGVGLAELDNTTGLQSLGKIGSAFETGSATFGSSVWIDSGPDLRIGIDVGLANSWRGEIAYVGFIRNHRITETELREAFAAFRAGRFK